MISKLNQAKILFLVKTMDIGGAERFTLNLCNYFIDKTAAITVASSGGIFVQLLEQKGINHIRLKTPPLLKNFFSLFIELRKIIRENDYSIIHCQHRIFTFILQFMMKKKFILVYTANNVFNDFYQKCIFPDFASAASGTIFHNLRRSSFILKNKITQINYGVKVPETCMPKTGIIALGFLGRLIEEKGIFRLLESIKILAADNLNFRLIIKGIGDLERITLFINQNNLSDFIIISSPSSDEEEIYKDINVLVLPTQMNEGLPVSILEAAARRILIVSTDAGGIKDFLKDGETGIMLASVDAGNIAVILKKTIINYNNYEPILDNALNKVKDEFSLEVMNSKYEAFYNGILKSIPS